MDASERWAQVSDILSRALDRPDAEREAFLAGEIDRNPSLRTEVLSMWSEMNGTGRFLEDGLPLTDLPPEPASDGTFGPYRVIGELGEGGMGVVFLAERSDGQFTRRVAIKRVGRAAPGLGALRRFTEERQILARLDHPHITRLLDSGLDAAGVPYLVMEHVEGVPITRFCAEGALPVPRRLELFLKVCAAVQHAHQHLVIHRDIKPGNILVTAAGEPKLLDFGIAKALDDSAPQDLTRTAQPALTLDYASPEQVGGQPVTTASDVYSLGVLLHELLADRKPYELGARSLAQAVRQVCELPVAPPSTEAPVERRSELRGDLDSIVAKAMEKAPGDRYGSAADLAADVSAHLAHLPVRARQPSFGYVALKFVRRHRAGAVVAAAGVLLVAAGVAAVAWQARVAERERARAQHRFEEVQQLAHYVIFDLQEGVAKLAGSTELRRGMIQRSLAYLDSLATEASGDPRLQAELADAYLKLGDVVGRFDTANLGDRAGALASYEKGRDLYRQAVAAQPGEPSLRRGLAQALRMVHGATEDPARKAALLAESMAIWEALAAEHPADEAILNGLASAQFAAFVAAGEGQAPAAVSHMERALEIFQRLLDAKPADLNRKRNVALCHKYLGNTTTGLPQAELERHLLEALRLDGERVAAEPLNPQAKLDYTFDLSMLGTQALGRNAPDEAMRRFDEALALRRDLWEADRANVQARDRLAAILMRAGVGRMLAGRTSEGEALLNESLSHARALAPDQRTTRDTFRVTYLFLGEAASLSRRDPCPWYRLWSEQVELARRMDPGSLKDFGPIAGAAERASKRLESCPKGLSPAS